MSEINYHDINSAEDCEAYAKQAHKRIKALEGVVGAGKQYLSYGGLTHHKDGCSPISKCECGLWKLRDALKKLGEVQDG